jgi:hypothetical protein
MPRPHRLRGSKLVEWYFRHPRTTQEKKAYYDAIEQGVKVRSKRKPHQLLDVYDDIYVSSWKARSKAKKQWERTGNYVMVFRSKTLSLERIKLR